MRFLSRSDTNQVAQSQKQARSLKFRTQEEEKVYYPCSENKGVIGFAVTAKLICVFNFAYADSWFSHEVAQVTRCYSLK